MWWTNSSRDPCGSSVPNHGHATVLTCCLILASSWLPAGSFWHTSWHTSWRTVGILGTCLLFACSSTSRTRVCDAVETLHDQLRDCVDLMGIGLGGQRSQDTVAEEGTAITKDLPKDIGDVRSASLLCFSRVVSLNIGRSLQARREKICLSSFLLSMCLLRSVSANVVAKFPAVNVAA